MLNDDEKCASRYKLGRGCPCVFAPVLGIDTFEVEGIRPNVVDRTIRGISRGTVVFLPELQSRDQSKKKL